MSKRAASDLKIGYPVAIDNDYNIWRAFENSYWPAHYLIDADGQIRYHHFGEGNYAQSEQAIQDLLREAGGAMAVTGPVTPNAEGGEASPDQKNIRSGETYLGYNRAANFVSHPSLRADTTAGYSVR